MPKVSKSGVRKGGRQTEGKGSQWPLVLGACDPAIINSQLTSFVRGAMVWFIAFVRQACTLDPCLVYNLV